jgi:hypothetical protein
MSKRKRRSGGGEGQAAKAAVAAPAAAEGEIPSWLDGRRGHLLALGILALLVAAMFGDLLFAGTRALGSAGTDLFLQFVSWREFGFGELARGNVPLWNPHIYGGAPYHGGLQAALFYPPNWLFLILPVAAAVNASIALNTWVLGALMYGWAAWRGLRREAALLAGGLMMFCTPHFLHIYAGHLTNLPAMVWAPLVFWAIDAWLAGRSARWLAAGAAAVGLQLLAGHPQYVFYTGIAAGLYTLVRWIAERHRWQRVLPLAAIHAGGALMAAVQLLPGIQSSRETIRDEALPWEFASMFGFPPENLVTLLVPNFFGDMVRQPYWGRCYLWEMSLFFGVAGFVLALVGAWRARPRDRAALLAVVAVTLVVALGKNTPLFRALYEFAPGFDKFRSVSKFIFQTSVFMVLFAGIGFDRLLRHPREARWVGAAAGGLGLLLACGLVWVQTADWGGVMRGVFAFRESYLDPRAVADAGFVGGARGFATGSLAIAIGTCGLAAVAAWYVGRDRRAVWGLMALAAVEVFAVARGNRATFDTASVMPDDLRKFYAATPGDFRVHNPVNTNSAMSVGRHDLWGFDPGVARRWAEFVTWSQGDDPAKATQYIGFKRLDPALALLRFKLVVAPTPEGLRTAVSPTPPLPHLLLVGRARVERGRDRVLGAIREIDPLREVVLEEEPEPRPADAADPGTAKVVGGDTDHLVIEADLKSPAVLVVTDAWTPSWKAVPLEGSAQAAYRVLPANYCLRGIPLGAGRHRIRLEYDPGPFRLGGWLSAGGWVLAAGVFLFGKRFGNPIDSVSEKVSSV